MTAALSTRFTDALWAASAPMRARIDDLEFLRRLADGSLPLDAFHRYIAQDALYLEGYAKALALLAGRAPDPVAGAFWATSSATAATVEASLHTSLLPATDTEAEHSPACLGYVSYLVAAAATQPYPVAAAAVLPCFWIYADVGRTLAGSARAVLAADPDHPFARWVTTYDAPEFQESAATARTLVDDAAAAATEAERDAMARAFDVATRYELMFWDTALNVEPWPTA